MHITFSGKMQHAGSHHLEIFSFKKPHLHNGTMVQCIKLINTSFDVKSVTDVMSSGLVDTIAEPDN